MHSTQLFQVLAVALATFSVTHASAAGPQEPRIPQIHEMVKRQSASESTSPSSSSRSSSTSSSRSTTPPTPTPTPTRDTSTVPPPQTTPSTTPPTPGPSTTPPASTTLATSTAPADTTKPPESSSTSRITITTIVTTTNSDGSVSTQTSQIVQETTVPNSSNSENRGMDEKQRNTIIGAVVGGVGGAIVLAVIGLVAWRVWGRKKNQEEVDNSFGTSAYTVAEKPEPTGGSTNSRTPFQSTLESYHAPTQVNTASNF